MIASPALLACDVFQNEIAALLAEPGALHPRSVTWLEMGLHDTPSRLRECIQKSIATIEADPEIDTILLAYGQCGNGLNGVRAGRCPLVLPRAHDCISILLGGPQRYADVLSEEPGTYFYSPGWIRGRRVPGPDRESYLRELCATRYPDDPEMVEEIVSVDRELFQHQCRAAYLDITNDKEAEKYCQECARHMGWKFTRLTGDASFLRDLLAGHHDPSRFVIAQPGEALALDAGGALTQA